MNRRIRSLPFLVAVAMTAAPLSTVLARDSRDTVGSAILPVYSVQHEAMHPGESAEVQACVANGNVHASRDIVPGDSFTFTFGAGTLGPCAGAEVHSPDAAFATSDFQCSVDGDALTIRYVGVRPVAWAGGDMACATASFVAPPGPATVLTSQDVSNEGAFAPPEPRVIALSVGPRLGTVGPQGETGPVGPAGPQGPPGLSGVGAATMAVSTDRMTRGRCSDSPALIPGLDLMVTVSAGSRIVVMTDLYLDQYCEGTPAPNVPWRFTAIDIEVDGVVVASRDSLNGQLDASTVSHVTACVLTDPLAAGQHRVRTLIRCRGGHPDEYLPCVGSAANDGRQARMIVLEQRAP